MKKRIAIIRSVATVGLITALGVGGYYWMVLGVRRCYFPREPIGDLLAILIPSVVLAAYFAITIWHGRFLWMRRSSTGE